MPAPVYTEQEMRAVIETWMATPDQSRSIAAEKLGLTKYQLDHRLEKAERKGLLTRKGGKLRPTFKLGEPAPVRAFSVPDLPDEDAPVEEIIARRSKEFGRRNRAADARKLIRIRMDETGPIGVAIFGDLHIDSPGCNLPLLLSHIDLVKKTPGLYAGCVGDLQDGWVGRLARLWATQGITAKESLKLVRHFMEELADKLLFIVEGNHDSWTQGVNGVSPVEWIAAHTGTITGPDGVRIAIEIGEESWTVNARHDFKGRSMYNPAHGGTKAALFGWRDDILLAGHTHESGIQILKDPKTGLVSHVLRVASYKHLDAFAKQEGFPDNNSFECPVVLLRPGMADQRFRLQVITDPFLGAHCLVALRKRGGRS